MPMTAGATTRLFLSTFAQVSSILINCRFNITGSGRSERSRTETRSVKPAGHRRLYARNALCGQRYVPCPVYKKDTENLAAGCVPAGYAFPTELVVWTGAAGAESGYRLRP